MGSEKPSFPCSSQLFNKIASIFIVCLSLSSSLITSAPVSVSFISTNFKVTRFMIIDNSGTFLASQNSTFQARIDNSIPESNSYYFVIVHVASNTVVWTANRNQPSSESSKLTFTSNGLGLYDDQGKPIWSTPENLSSAAYMHLTETGNLVLLDGKNSSLWESFDFPSDVLVPGQKLATGKSLVSSVNDGDPSEGNYSLVINDRDAVLQWYGMNYWRLSMNTRAFTESNNVRVSYMVMNSSGLFLMGGNNDEKPVIKVPFNDVSSNSFWIVKLDHKGVLNVLRIDLSDRSSNQVFTGPSSSDGCKIPNICGELGACSINGGSCQCAPGFRIDPNLNYCVPADNTLALPSSCNSSLSSTPLNSTVIDYVSLRSDLDYFANDFTDPVMNMDLSACKNLCSSNCSCLGVFYSQSSGWCYMIWNHIGSLMINSSPNTNRLGYIKTIVVQPQNEGDSGNKKSDFTVLSSILLPVSGVILISLVATIIWLRRRRRRRMWEKSLNSKLGDHSRSYAADGEEMDFVSIPGLPVRFTYKELVKATEDFKTQIGSGGFGTVYKGSLRDGTQVAVKKITCLGAEGKREFLTEIAVIGKVHHVNLVRLKGFCAYRGQRFLVYEYMSRGSLDRTLFRGDRALEWSERYEIALGTARGLSYLHSGCEHKIIHCDVKPENILLHEKSQVKISDFGLSKLLSPEQSGLFTTMRGTRGYLAPEWLTSAAISDKTDVYSYGMVLLELVRGKKNSSTQMLSDDDDHHTTEADSTNTSPLSRESRARFVYFPLFALEMHEQRRYLELADPRLVGRVRSEEVERLVRVALCCVHEEPGLRPSMSNVVGMLEGSVALSEPRIESLSFLRFYGRRFTEASTLGGREPEELVLCRQPQTTNTSSSYNSFSYMSSQEVSGPR